VAWYRFGSRSIQRRERAEEMRAHLDLYADELVSRGWSAEDARREARLKFGNPRVKLEEVDAMNRIPLVETLGRDLRTAFRGLRAAPGFTAAVLAVLTLSMGATTAVFSVVDGVVLRGLPFGDGDRLVAFDRPPDMRVFSVPEFLLLREQQGALFDGVAAIAEGNVVLKRDAESVPEILRAQRVTADFFPVLRVTPAIGRAFTTEHEREGREHVGVISHGLWQRRFGGASDVLGKRLPAEGGDVEILGVMPSGFAYPVGAVQPTDLWMPYAIREGERAPRVSAYLRLIARLRDGVNIDNAQTRLDGLAASHARIATGTGRLTLRDLRESLVGDTRGWMLMLLASVACVLLIACANIANLLLVRSTVRIRELSVRSALGATRWDLTRMLLAESLVLSTAGAALGVLVAWWGSGALRSLLPPHLPRLANIAVDWRVLGVSAVAAVVTGIAFGLAPAFHSSRAIDQALRSNSRTDTPSTRVQWLRATFLVAEVALAAVLLIGASLFLTSFARLMGIDLGLDYRSVLTVDVRPKSGTTARLTHLLEQAGRIPGVESVAITTANLPFSLTSSMTPLSDIPGRALSPDLVRQGIASSWVSQDYFRTLRIPLLKGRYFTAADTQGSELVVILNETAARTYFPDRDPVGQRFGVHGSRTIVGVVGDVRGSGPERTIQRESFVPMAQGEVAGGTLLLKTSRNSDVVSEQVKAAIWSEFPGVAIPAPRTLEQSLGRLIAGRRFSMLLLTLFGVLGLTIASTGIYGVMTYVVTQRTREIGIRMALGALSSTMLWSVLRRASAHVAAGLFVGLGAAWFLTTSVDKFLFRVEPHDFRLYAVVGGVLAFAALGAAFFPARRAARVDPLIALRLE
jgi:putative ABC transport system permease protein